MKYLSFLLFVVAIAGIGGCGKGETAPNTDVTKVQEAPPNEPIPGGTDPR
jgi:hypothetical protein